MAIPNTEQEIFDKIQNMQPGDDFTLADAVLGMLRAQRLTAKAILELSAGPGFVTAATRQELEQFLKG